MPPISVIVTKGTFLSSSYGDIIIEFQQYKKVCPEHGELQAEDIVSGYEYHRCYWHDADMLDII